MRSADMEIPLTQRFDEYLRQNKKRRTAERFAILEKTQGIQGHFSAEELGEMLREDGFPVSSATIYSTLEILVNFGFLVRQRFANHACLYERASASASSVHHHLICTSCGKIKEVRDPAFSTQLQTRRFPGFSQSYYTLNIYGVCSACNRRKKKSKKNQ